MKQTIFVVALSLISISLKGQSVENVFVGVHRMEITSVTNADFSNFGGTGLIRLTSDTMRTAVSFQNLTIRQAGSFIVMDAGEFTHSPDTTLVTNLTASQDGEQLSNVVFNQTSYRMDNTGINYLGNLQGTFLGNNLSYTGVETAANSYEIIGFQLNEVKEFSIENGAITVQLDTSRIFGRTNNQYVSAMKGTYLAQESFAGEPFTIAFETFNQNTSEVLDIEYITLTETRNWTPSANLPFSIRATSGVFDISTTKSFGSLDPSTKGVFFENASLNLNDTTLGAVTFTEEQTILQDLTLSFQGDGNIVNFNRSITASGEKSGYDLSIDSLSFQWFGNNTVSGSLNGTIKISFLASDDISFAIPFDTTGFGAMAVVLEGGNSTLTAPFIQDNIQINDNSFTINWLAEENVQDYRVTLLDSAGAIVVNDFDSVSVAETTYTFDVLDGGTTYQVKVSVNYLDGSTSSFVPFSIQTTGEKPVVLSTAAIDSRLKLYPNPISGQTLTLSGTTRFSEGYIYNSSGESVYRISKESLKANTYKLVLEKNLAPGLYFLKLKSLDGLVTKKFIVR